MHRFVLAALFSMVTLPAALAWSQMGNLPRSMPDSIASAPLATSPITQPMVLTDSKINGFFAAVDELQKVSDTANSAGKLNPNDPMSFATALSASGETDRIIRKHGFTDLMEFQRVGYNAAMANAVLEKGGKAAVGAELEKAKADQAKALEQMRTQMSPEQLKLVEAQMNAGLATSESVQNVPDGNLELMKKYSGRMNDLNK